MSHNRKQRRRDAGDTMPTIRQVARQRGVFWGGLSVAVLAIIVATPFILSALAPKDQDWGQLSDISQTYGALSVIVSAAALVGVVLSIAYQARQTRIQNEESHRSAHRELMLLILSDPTYLVCLEPPNTSMTEDRFRQIIVANLFVSMWSSDYKLGLIDDLTLRAVLEDYFHGEIGRAYWSNSRRSWNRYFDASRDARERRFVRIADEAHAASTAAGPPVLTSDYFTLPTTPSTP